MMTPRILHIRHSETSLRVKEFALCLFAEEVSHLIGLLERNDVGASKITG